MKRFLFILLLCGCQSPNTPPNKIETVNLIEGEISSKWYEFDKDGHTYIYYNRGGQGGLEHHPDCRCQLRAENMVDYSKLKEKLKEAEEEVNNMNKTINEWKSKLK